VLLLSLQKRLGFGRAFEEFLNKKRRWDPAYYGDIKKHEIRIMWDLNGDRLKLRIPFIVTVWDINALIHPMFPEWVDTPYGFDDYAMRAAYIICGTEVGARQIAHHCNVSPERIRVIPFPTPEFALAGRAGEECRLTAGRMPYLFYPARFWPHKNHVTVIRALALLKQKGLKINLVLTGRNDGNHAYIKDLADSLGVTEQITYLGVLTLDELTLVYRNSFCLVYASLFGPDNLPPLEAFGLGVPVIASEIPGAREQYGNACLYFAPTSEESLASRILELHSDSQLQWSLIELGRARANSWTADHYVQRFADIIEEFELLARTWQYCDSEFPKPR
jgi:glycosyltransferase involved in cell wall biosynthesis